MDEATADLRQLLRAVRAGSHFRRAWLRWESRRVLAKVGSVPVVAAAWAMSGLVLHDAPPGADERKPGGVGRGSLRADLVLGLTTGSFRERQRNVRAQRHDLWLTAAAVVEGVLSPVVGEGIVWRPSSYWRHYNAQEVLIETGEIRGADIVESRLGRALRVETASGEVWFALHRGD